MAWMGGAASGEDDATRVDDTGKIRQ
jgi:hypothetical protein